MKKNTAAKGKFKSKGDSILKTRKSGPESMKEFLGDSTEKSTSGKSTTSHSTQNYKTTIAQEHTSANAKTHKTYLNNKTGAFQSNRPASEKIERLHVHIRKDLADMLLEMVFKRKCDRDIKKNQATQRVIIEEALEEYFSRLSK